MAIKREDQRARLPSSLLLKSRRDLCSLHSIPTIFKHGHLQALYFVAQSKPQTQTIKYVT